MDSNGKVKFYLRLSFYTFVFIIIYIGYLIYLISNNMMLRNNVNIVLSIIVLSLVGFSLFQKMIIKYSNNNIKLAISLLVVVILFTCALFANNKIIGQYLDKEEVKEFNSEKYITKEINGNVYYYKIISNYIKSFNASLSIEKKSIKDDDGSNYNLTTIVYYDSKGQISKIETDGEIGE